MRYDFDTVVPRLGTDSVKWDLYAPDVLPMWVADMDFQAAPAIRAALQRRLDHGIFGYEQIPQAYYDAVTGWFARRHGWTGFGRQDIIPTTGVIAAYSACVKAVTKPGDKVITMPPVYNHFPPAVINNRCVASLNNLVYRDGTYSIDFEDLERKAADPQATALLLCNPQNPAGRVWTREELLRIAEICYRHDVFVISDEIHCELTFPGHPYTPYGTLPEPYVRRSASCISPTKAFNIAGIQIANIVATDPEARRKIDRAINDNECCDVNVFGVTALMAAYNESGEWLDALLVYLEENARLVREFFAREVPQVVIPPLEGTYLMWLDCRALFPAAASCHFDRAEKSPSSFSDRLADHLRDRAKVALCSGSIYGEVGDGFLRLNIACPRKTLQEGLDRIRDGLLSFPS